MDFFKIILAYPCLGKTFFTQNLKKNCIEIPLSTFLSLRAYLKPTLDPTFTLKETQEILSNYYNFYLHEVTTRYPDVLFLGPGTSMGYQILNKVPNCKLISLIPDFNCFEDFIERWKLRESKNPLEKDMNLFENQKQAWTDWIPFFKRAAQNDPNIIFTKPGEYLTDYLDINTGEPMEKMLQGLEEGQRRVKGL